MLSKLIVQQDKKLKKTPIEYTLKINVNVGEEMMKLFLKYSEKEWNI